MLKISSVVVACLLLTCLGAGHAMAQQDASSSSSASQEDGGDFLASMFGGAPKDMEKRLAEAAKHPFGSHENPIRVNMPEGERDYLKRLRCANGKRPEFERGGSVGTGPYNHILDVYDVKCPGSEPAQSDIYMDMYFADYHETRAPEGFTIKP